MFFLSFMLDLSKYAGTNISYILNNCCGNILLLILVYVYTCFSLLHHIDVHEQQRLHFSDCRSILFNNVQCINLKERCAHYTFTYFLNHYLMGYWTIKGSWKISFWTRSKAHSLHSYFPLYENKRESWIHSKHLLKRGIFSSTMFKLCFQTNIYLFLPICVYLVYIVISLWL